ncbi:hypothetical protein ACQPZF_23590 [Actinosynnema sp. CS-041913]|uniref:hypothetical protein n=1 Tax=Actinosynnema sp. CS-041913 TaxID=3239917 RepID=UPI003D92B78C
MRVRPPDDGAARISAPLVVAAHPPSTPAPPSASPASGSGPRTGAIPAGPTAVQRQPTGDKGPPSGPQGFRITNPTVVQRIGPAVNPAVAGPSRPTSAPSSSATPAPASTVPATPSTVDGELPTTNRLTLTGEGASDNLDKLARMLIDPVARLLRAELRAGRERAGRLHDRRR